MIEFSLQKKLHTARGEMLLDVSGKLEQGRLYCLYGPSGAGKTSILRMLAGFMTPDAGSIITDGTPWFDAQKRIRLTPQRRRTGFVFQDYALFPNMNVREHLAFALPRKAPRERVDALLESSGLSTFASRKIAGLSGGQQQRLALARAIATEPRLLLLDEPLSAIDSEMRLQLQAVLLTLHRELALTTVLVSHDSDEIIRLADEVIHLEEGHIRARVHPAAFFLSPAERHMLRGSVVSSDPQHPGKVTLLVRDRVLEVDVSGFTGNLSHGDEVEIRYADTAPIIRKL